MNRNIEQEAAEALLDVGISLPLFRVKLPFFKPWDVRVTMRRPFWGTQMRIERIYLREGISIRQLKTMNEDEEMKFFDEHLTALSQILALTICRGYLAGIIFVPLVAFLIRWRVPREYMLEAQRRFCRLRPSRDFTIIIAWAEGTNPFRPGTSQRKKNGS